MSHCITSWLNMLRVSGSSDKLCRKSFAASGRRLLLGVLSRAGSASATCSPNQKDCKWGRWDIFQFGFTFIGQQLFGRAKSGRVSISDRFGRPMFHLLVRETTEPTPDPKQTPQVTRDVRHMAGQDEAKRAPKPTQAPLAPPGATLGLCDLPAIRCK